MNQIIFFIFILEEMFSWTLENQKKYSKFKRNWNKEKTKIIIFLLYDPVVYVKIRTVHLDKGRNHYQCIQID